MTEERKSGRPALPPGEKLVVVPVRLTETQKAKLQRIGVQQLRGDGFTLPRVYPT